MSSILSVQIRGAQGIKPFAAPIIVQVDNMGLIEAAAMGGAIPNYPYDAYVSGVPMAGDGNYLIQQGDVLVDAGLLPINYDANTVSGKVEYQVAGLPEPFDFDHVELKVIRYREKTVNEYV